MVLSCGTRSPELVMDDYLDWMSENGFSSLEVKCEASCLHYFLDWLGDDYSRIIDVNNDVLLKYRCYLWFIYREERELLMLYIHQLEVLRSFFSWLFANRYLSDNPAAIL